MNRDQVIYRFCKLASKVNDKKFNWSEPSDCFCQPSKPEDYQFDETVMLFIEEAVSNALAHVKEKG